VTERTRARVIHRGLGKASLQLGAEQNGQLPFRGNSTHTSAETAEIARNSHVVFVALMVDCRSAALWFSPPAEASALGLKKPSCYYLRVLDPRLPPRSSGGARRDDHSL
jgi:hypothetical protein